MLIIVSSNIQLLIGIGPEYLVGANNQVILKFYNGWIVSNNSAGNLEQTLVPADLESVKKAS